MEHDAIAQEIAQGNAVLGIEYGSTRIKAVLVDSKTNPIASGGYTWESVLEDGVWTYPLSKIHEGIVAAYAQLKSDVQKKYGVPLARLKAMGVSAMMHGYLAFDAQGNLLVPFRTWRNTITGRASRELTALFGFPIPERWSIAHFYEAILNCEPHVPKVDFFTTLSGYAHWMLCKKKVLGADDASGMFPLNSEGNSFDKKMILLFDQNPKVKNAISKSVEALMPKVLLAGEDAGTLSEEGARWLDPTGDLQAGALLAPPEGDAGTGMAATNSVAPRTGNISAGTSAFAMVVLERPLSKAYPGVIDIVATPDGKPAAMAHANNCTAEYNKWVELIGEAARILGADFSKEKLYDAILGQAKNGDADCGGVCAVNYIAGESITQIPKGVPLVLRKPNSNFTLANFIKSQVYSAVATLRLGMDVLFAENVKIDSLTGHGGFFKTQGVGLETMAAAMKAPVSAMATAGEGGAWGMALLAAYAASGKGVPLGEWLKEQVFCNAQKTVCAPDAALAAGFEKFLQGYKKALEAEKAAALYAE